MIATMHRGTFLISLGFAGLLVLTGPPARAQFYDLDGAYHCVTQSDPACAAEAKLPPPPPPPRAASAGPTVESVFAAIRAQKLSPADMQLLEAHAGEKEPRALEAFAWCKLNGIGWAADPIAAYLLYGAAAALGVPKAHANQIAIFETRLTQQQRQDLLMILQTIH
jgi:TPR repeat protein